MSRRLPRAPWIAIGLVHAFVALGALIGGGAFLLRPDGSLIQADPSWLAHSPFRTYLIPGLILFVMVGLANVAAAVVAWRRAPWAGWFTAAVGAILMGWIVGEFLLVRLYHWMQPMYFGLGLVLVVAGLVFGRPREMGRDRP
jgi:hypothetical protein